MRYELLEEAGRLGVECDVGTVDVFAVGVLHTNLQDILDKTAFWLLSEEGLLEPTWKRPRYLPHRVPSSHERIVRAQIDEIKRGSLFEVLSLSVASALADPNIRAVLLNLFASAIWAMGASGVRGIRARSEQSAVGAPPPLRRRSDPLHLGANLREIALALAETSEGKTIELIFRHQSPRQEISEVIIRIEGNRQ